MTCTHENNCVNSELGTFEILRHLAACSSDKIDRDKFKNVGKNDESLQKCIIYRIWKPFRIGACG